MINNIRKKDSGGVSYFRYIFTFIGIRSNNLPTEFLPNLDRDANHYATKYL